MVEEEKINTEGADTMELDSFVEYREAAEDEELVPTALYLHGTDNMNTASVLNCMCEFAPSFVKWLHDSACLVHFTEEISVLRCWYALTQDPTSTMPTGDALKAAMRAAAPIQSLPALKGTVLRAATLADVPSPLKVTRGFWKDPRKERGVTGPIRRQRGGNRRGDRGGRGPKAHPYRQKGRHGETDQQQKKGHGQDLRALLDAM